MPAPTESPGPPRLSVGGHIARIVLRRPEQHNAIEAEDVRAMCDHLDEVDADRRVRAMIVTGSGTSTFCAGASLRAIETGEMSGALFTTMTDRLAAVRAPTVCALNGSAFGGGAELALACDFRLGVAGSRMSVPAARLGLCYPLAGLERFVRTLGLGTARRLLVAGEELGSDEMLEIGFLDRCVARDELIGAAEDLAGRLSRLAPLAVQAMKRTLSEIAAGAVEPDAVRARVAACEGSADLAEGLLARREGRPPEFRGD